MAWGESALIKYVISVECQGKGHVHTDCLLSDSGRERGGRVGQLSNLLNITRALLVLVRLRGRVCVCDSLFVRLSVCLSVWLCGFLSHNVSVCLAVCVCFCVCISLPASLSFSFSDCLYVCEPVLMSVCLFICLVSFLAVCLCIFP